MPRGYGQQDYPQQAPGQGGFLPAGAGPADRLGPEQDYHAEVYPQPGFEQSDYPRSDYSQSDYSQAEYPKSGFPQNGYEPDGFGPNGIGPDEPGQDAAPPAAQDSYGQQTSGPGFPPGGTGAAGASYQAQDYQTEAYPLAGSEAPASGQNGFAQNGFPENGSAQNGSAQNGFGRQAGYGQDGYDQGAYPQDGYFPTGYDQDGYSPPGYGPDGFSPPGATPGSPPAGFPQDVYGQGGYNQDSYAPPGFEQPSGPGYDDDLPSRGRPPRSGLSGSGQLGSPHRLSRVRMVLYLAASVIGVVLIVYLVVHMTKSGTNSAASGSSTPSTGATAKAKATASAYVLTPAAKVGNYPLNTTVTHHFASILESQSAPAVTEIKAKGAGQPGTPVVGIYDLGSVTSSASADYKGLVFVGYGGTYNPTAVIKVEQSLLRSARVVSAGPHGGAMVCGYSEPTGSEVTECAWVTKTTFGNVEFIQGEDLVQYPGAAQLTLDVRNAVEGRGS